MVTGSEQRKSVLSQMVSFVFEIFLHSIPFFHSRVYRNFTDYPVFLLTSMNHHQENIAMVHGTFRKVSGDVH